MSLSEIGRFVTDLKSNTALRAAAAKAEPDASSPMSVTEVVSLAASNGYSFTVEEASRFVAAVRSRIDDKRLTDAELDGVAAAGELEDLMASMAGLGADTEQSYDPLADHVLAFLEQSYDLTKAVGNNDDGFAHEFLPSIPDDKLEPEADNDVEQ